MKHLTCPVCASNLTLSMSQKSLQCTQSHSFDLAKQGYANLLLSHHKKSKHPGDTQEMVSSRTAFLDKGHYRKIANHIKGLIQKHSVNPINAYCDIACGEGYYTNLIHQHLSTHTIKPVTTNGIDISQPAIKAACKRSKEIQWLIASTKNIPLVNDSQDLVTGLFFHFDHQEIARILRPEGIFIFTSTGSNHLIELRRKLYDEIKDEKNDKESKLGDNILTHIDSNKLSKTISLKSSAEVMQLLSMTPHYWRTTIEKKQALAKVQEMDITIDVQFDIFRNDMSLRATI